VGDDSAKRSVSRRPDEPGGAARAIKTLRGVVIALQMAPMRLLCGPSRGRNGEPI
jgi:hypothetical protein